MGPQHRQPLSLGTFALIVAGAVALLLLVLPLVVLVLRGLSTRGWEGTPGSGVPEAIGLSLFTTLITALLTLIFGTPLAYIFARWRFPFRRLLNVLVELPIVLPPAV